MPNSGVIADCGTARRAVGHGYGLARSVEFGVLWMNDPKETFVIVEIGAEGGSIKILGRIDDECAPSYSVQLRDQSLALLLDEGSGSEIRRDSEWTASWGRGHKGFREMALAYAVSALCSSRFPGACFSECGAVPKSRRTAGEGVSSGEVDRDVSTGHRNVITGDYCMEAYESD
jgi:hypothetical protein